MDASNGTPAAWVDGSARHITQTSSALPANARPADSSLQENVRAGCEIFWAKGGKTCPDNLSLSVAGEDQTNNTAKLLGIAELLE
jgi:hypothetical protein